MHKTRVRVATTCGFSRQIGKPGPPLPVSSTEDKETFGPADLVSELPCGVNSTTSARADLGV